MRRWDRLVDAYVEECRARGISEATGISMTTLSRIMLGNAQRIDQGTVDKLLTHFSNLLNEDLTIGDLLEWKRDSVNSN